MIRMSICRAKTAASMLGVCTSELDKQMASGELDHILVDTPDCQRRYCPESIFFWLDHQTTEDAAAASDVLVIREYALAHAARFAAWCEAHGIRRIHLAEYLSEAAA